jgi:hypothetical protein
VGDPEGTIMLEPKQAVTALFHDCSEKSARQAASALRPMNPAVDAQPLTRAGWRVISATFVRGSQDRMPEIVGLTSSLTPKERQQTFGGELLQNAGNHKRSGQAELARPNTCGGQLANANGCGWTVASAS